MGSGPPALYRQARDLELFTRPARELHGPSPRRFSHPLALAVTAPSSSGADFTTPGLCFGSGRVRGPSYEGAARTP